MRFTKQPRHQYEDTRRKRLAALRRQQRERESFPLIAAEIGEKQPDIDTIMAARVNKWAEWEDRQRQHKAAQWREGRQRLASFEDETRKAALAYWNNHKWLPGTPSYFLDMLHSIETGRLVRDGQTFRPARITVSAAEAIQEIGTSKPPMLPGLIRPKAKTGGLKP
jgi:hypothetical protein